ncbi:PREDICTED: adenosine deaminase-like protein [Ceratosolen solmsi marchali]|uniref:Adenosine deaminase-like protein n=1 Tax=Ceratosolen solmsi marchali TaxID=326594 RepID=A0AAJ6VKJ1_9HYME|nr:PREDICTED: adenosine deaminase-like protein [Ceratosolen solmsi marchali]
MFENNSDIENSKCLQQFCQILPKIELHAHLNGALSKKTLDDLYKMKYPEKTDTCEAFNFASLKEVFEVFNIVYSVTTTPEAVFIATYNTIKEFYEDNVIYLELRSTPRAENGMTKTEYVLAILKAIETCQTEKIDIIVKLLISINRKQGYKAAKENIHLAIDMCKEYKNIVGIDLSGDPTKGEAFIELLYQARKAGLKIAAHCAEVANEVECMNILKFKPERLGHGTCIHQHSNGSERLYQTLLDSKIPVEICLTSNVKCKTVANYSSHHFKYLYESKHPVCICTDDKGVFDTTLSKEFTLAVEHFNLNKSHLVNLMKSTVNYAFASDIEKNKMIEIIDNFKNVWI